MRPVRRQRGEEAAAAVEFAILAPLVFMLVFGMLSGALAWNSKQTITHAAREGVRYAATLPAPPTADTPDWPTWFEKVRDRVVEQGFGDLDETASNERYICIAYLDGSGDPPPYVDHNFDDPPATPKEGCFDSSLALGPGEARVEILAARKTDFFAVLLSHDLVLQSGAASRHEGGK